MFGYLPVKLNDEISRQTKLSTRSFGYFDDESKKSNRDWFLGFRHLKSGSFGLSKF